MTNTWTSSDDVCRQVQRLWDRGLVLAEIAGAPSIFPYRLRLSRPAPADLLNRYDEVRVWARSLLAMPDVRVVTSVQGARSIGRNEIPREVWIDDLRAAATLLGRTDEADVFRNLVELTRTREPGLVDWVAAHPVEATAAAGSWWRLLQIVGWLRTHPRPGIYVRQVDLHGVDTKFIERNAPLLSALLDTVLPPDVIWDDEYRFEPRYGFRSAPRTVQIRALDPAIAVSVGVQDRPITLTLDDFGELSGVQRVFVTENQVNFLAFPMAERSIVVFGEGYDVAKIAAAPWITSVPVHYWGDIDTHGFAILDHLRLKLPNVTSMLMDRATLFAHEGQWGEEVAQVRRELPGLSRAERDLYDDLRDNRIRANLRLEQELIRYGAVRSAIATLVGVTEVAGPPRQG